MSRPLRILLRILGGAATLLAVILILAWLTGRVWSDRHPISQWLAWIPTPALLPAVIVGLLCASRPRRQLWWKRTEVRIWLATGLALTLYFGLVEHRLLIRAADPGTALSVVNWNMTHDASSRDDDAYIEQVLKLLGDVTVLVNGHGVSTNPDLIDRLPTGTIIAHIGRRMSIYSRYPIIEARAVVMSDSGGAVLLRVAGGDVLQRPLTMYIVDLPSDPRRGRAHVTGQLRIHLNNAGAPPPDLVLGDFNIPRGSASLDSLFPGMRNAYREAGHGYGASFHREFPLYHIDHVLLGEDIACRRYDLIDPGVGRHRLQRAYIEKRTSSKHGS